MPLILARKKVSPVYVEHTDATTVADAYATFNVYAQVANLMESVLVLEAEKG